jgi:hypothetical protein
MPAHKRLLDYAMLALMAICGWVAAPGWFILLAAAGLSMDECAKLWLEVAGGEMPSSKAITYAVTGIVANVGYATFSYFFGAVLRGTW